MYCFLVSYELESIVALFTGTISSAFLFPSISGHLIYFTGEFGPSMEDEVRKGAVLDLIVTPMSGVFPVFGGGMENGEAEPEFSFPESLGVPYTFPYGQNLCGANKFKYLSFSPIYDEEFMEADIVFEADIAFIVKFN
jgi:hypothetical protein